MPNLTNNSDSITFSENQKNSITLSTNKKFVDSNISLTTLVTKAVLTTNSQDTDHKTFQIQIPNGSPSNNITFTFEVDSDGNVTVS